METKAADTTVGREYEDKKGKDDKEANEALDDWTRARSSRAPVFMEAATTDSLTSSPKKVEGDGNCGVLGGKVGGARLPVLLFAFIGGGILNMASFSQVPIF